MTDINNLQIANVDGTSHTAGTTEKFKAIVMMANRKREVGTLASGVD